MKDEEARPWSEGPGEFGNSVAAALEMEDMVIRAPDVEGVVLRYGYFYGPGTHFAPGGGAAEEVRRRRLPVVGRGTGLFSFIHVEDAAAATALAVEHGRPGVYNVVDDEPAEMRECAGRDQAEVAGGWSRTSGVGAGTRTSEEVSAGPCRRP